MARTVVFIPNAENAIPRLVRLEDWQSAYEEMPKLLGDTVSFCALHCYPELRLGMFVKEKFCKGDHVNYLATCFSMQLKFPQQKLSYSKSCITGDAILFSEQRDIDEKLLDFLIDASLKRMQSVHQE